MSSQGVGLESQQFAVLGADYPGCRPSLQVAIGDRVTAGDELFRERLDPDLRVLAPVSGSVADIHRGLRRRLDAIVIDAANGERPVLPKLSPAPPDDYASAKALLLASGFWSRLRQRPFGVVPSTITRPDRLFVVLQEAGATIEQLDLLKRESAALAAGLRALGHLAERETVVCCTSRADLPGLPGNITVEVMHGQPAVGMAGRAIHARCTPSLARPVFEVDLMTVIDLGRCLVGQSEPCERLVRIQGDGVSRPGIYPAVPGQSVEPLMTMAAVAATPGIRQLAGCELTGRSLASTPRFIGLRDRQLTTVREAGLEPLAIGYQVLDQTSWLAKLWQRPGPMTSRLNQAAPPRPMLPAAALERVWPHGVPVLPLLRALLVNDDDTAMNLGALAFVEEDMALVTSACPAGYDYGQALRAFLDRVREAEE